MPIVFNFFAIIQVIVLLLFWFFLYLITEFLGIGSNVNDNVALIYKMLAASVITGYLDIRGLKGKLFYLPTWLVCIIVAIFFLQIFLSDVLRLKHGVFVYIISVLIIWGYYALYKIALRKKWEQKKMLLLELQKKMENEEAINSEEYWTMASQVHFKPPYIFLYFGFIWKLLFKNIIDGNDFLNYYKVFLNSIDLKEVQKENHKMWIVDFKESVAKAKSFDDYEHPLFSISRLGNIIDYTNEKIKT